MWRSITDSAKMRLIQRLCGKKNYELNGFTLIELLVVIAIIAVLVGIVVVAIDPVALIGRSNDTKKRSEFQQMKNSLQLYFNDFTAYPATASALVSGGYTRSLPDSFAEGDAIYLDTPLGEYRAGVDLDNPSTLGDDDNSYTECGGAGDIPSGPTWDDADYFICPD